MKIFKLLTFKKILILIVVIVVGFFAYNSLKPKVTEIDAEKVKISDVTQEITADGKVSAGTSFTASFELTGKITYQPFKAGDKITKGTRLASIDSSIYRNAYDRALKDFNLSYSLLNEYDLSQKDKPLSDQSKLDRKQVDIPLQQAESLVADARTNLAKTSIYSPITGIVTSVSKKVGETATATQTVLTIQTSDNPEFTAEIDDVDIVKIIANQKTEIILDAYPDEKFLGTVTEIAPSKTKNANGIEVYLIKIAFNTSGRVVYLDQNGQASIIQKRQSNVLNVSTSAIIEDGDKKYVYQIKNKKAFKTPVTTGLESDFETEITSGLAENDIVSVTNQNLTDNARVKIN